MRPFGKCPLPGPPRLMLAILATLSLADHGVHSASAADQDTSRRSWFRFEPMRDDFSPTILDGSSFVEAPTGQHGFVQTKGERFVFEDGSPVRFWGAQMGLWDKDRVDYAVRRMRRQGINITRLPSITSYRLSKSRSKG